METREAVRSIPDSLNAAVIGQKDVVERILIALLAGRHASRLRGRGLTFEELRHYHQGDDVRTMDWKATARLRSPHVRVYTEERERPVLPISTASPVPEQVRALFGNRRRPS
jgi:uncharacterized protein (DUF58 family)